jgi:hypothetical protein
MFCFAYICSYLCTLFGTLLHCGNICVFYYMYRLCKKLTPLALRSVVIERLISSRYSSLCTFLTTYYSVEVVNGDVKYSFVIIHCDGKVAGNELFYTHNGSAL